MNAFRKGLVSAALLLSITAEGALFAQDEDQNAPEAPPVVPVVPQPGDDDARDKSSRDWRGEVAADREQKGWGPDRPRSQSKSRQNWGREYVDRAYPGGQERWDRFRDPQDRSDRIGGNRNSFTPLRPDARANAETQAQAYAALYWMMKAQAEQEQQRDRR